MGTHIQTYTHIFTLTYIHTHTHTHTKTCTHAQLLRIYGGETTTTAGALDLCDLVLCDHVAIVESNLMKII